MEILLKVHQNTVYIKAGDGSTLNSFVKCYISVKKDWKKGKKTKLSHSSNP